jgi:non-specific serine/threonine protein kinase
MRRGLRVPLVLVVAALPVAAIVIARAAIDLLPASAADSAAGYRWIAFKPRPPLSRTEVAGAALGDDIYVIGGFVPPGATTSAVERLHNGHWSRVRSLPVGLNHAGAVGYRGHVYVVGGYAGRNGLTEPVRSLYRYDPDRNRWKQLADMPAARAALAVGATGGRIYAAGGSDGREQTARLEIYDIARNRWSRGPSLSVAREHLGGAAAGGRFYAVAGRNGESGNLHVFEAYDPKRRRWTRLPDVPKERGGNGAASDGVSVYAIGGEEAEGTIAEVDVYGIKSREWRHAPDMPTPRHGLAVAADAGGDIWVVEGGPQPGFAFSNAAERLTH